jgi:uncharacterized protein
MHLRAHELISALALSPHPEGGFFREIHRSKSQVDPRDGRGDRPALTVIYFLLTAGDVSRWHRVASDEVWHFLEGAPLALQYADPDLAEVRQAILGPYAGNAEPARVVDAGWWQAARTLGEYTLVGCTVGPGFDFADFAMLRELPDLADAFRTRHPESAPLL